MSGGQGKPTLVPRARLVIAMLTSPQIRDCLRAVLTLHHPARTPDHPDRVACAACRMPYPCPTARAAGDGLDVAPLPDPSRLDFTPW